MRIIETIALIAVLAFTSCKQQVEPFGPTPTSQQIALQDMEMYAFIHYSLNTYTDQEWGYGNEDPQLFNPQKLDCRQWASICRDSGMKGIIFTAKHHCGFCMWPSKYTEYSVKNSPWKNGEGDVVRELAEACKEYGLKFAVYLSPWDRNHPEYGRPEYITYFRNQLKELLTEYGDIYEVWFDGANGGNGWYGGADEYRWIDRTTYYEWPETYAMIRQLQPNAIIWNDGGLRGDLRWVGTEAGFIGETNWSLLNKDGDVPYEQLHYGVEDGNVFVPGETNTSIRPGWFYHDSENDKVKSLKVLMDTYYKSVGRNSTLILNFPIDKDGLIHQEDSINGAAFKKMIDTVFKDNLAKGAKVTASNTRRSFSANDITDGDELTYWATDEDVKEAVITIDLETQVTFNRMMLRENISLGQRIKQFNVEALINGEWKQLKDIISEEPERSMTTIGRKRILCFENITTNKVRINITEAKACPTITEIGLYLAPYIGEDGKGKEDESITGYNVTPLTNEDIPGVIISIDEDQEISKVFLLPNQQNNEGTPLSYILSCQRNDGGWDTLKIGEFSNIINNPIWQVINFEAGKYKTLRLDFPRLSSGGDVKYEKIKLE